MRFILVTAALLLAGCTSDPQGIDAATDGDGMLPGDGPGTATDEVAFSGDVGSTQCMYAIPDTMVCVVNGAAAPPAVIETAPNRYIAERTGTSLAGGEFAFTWTPASGGAERFAVRVLRYTDCPDACRPAESLQTVEGASPLVVALEALPLGPGEALGVYVRAAPVQGVLEASVGQPFEMAGTLTYMADA